MHIFRLNTNPLLRIGVAFACMYPAVSAWFSPYAWVGYFPPFITVISPLEPLVLLHVFGALEIALGLWLLFGARVRIPALLASALLTAIVIFNLNQMDVVFRDISILLMALALLIEDTRAHRGN